MATMQPRLADPVLMEAYASLQRRYEQVMPLEAIAARPYEPLKTNSFREAIAQACSRVAGYFPKQARTIQGEAPYINKELIPAAARVKTGADYLKSLFTELSDRVAYRAPNTYSGIVGYAFSSQDGILIPPKLPQSRRGRILLAGALLTLILGLATVALYRSYPSRPVPVRSQPPRLVVEPPHPPAAARPAELPSAKVYVEPLKPSTTPPAARRAEPAPRPRPSEKYSQMPHDTGRDRALKKAAEQYKAGPFERDLTHEDATNPRTILK